MKIAVIGTGYVGLVAGACFAELGNDVTCVDVDSEKVRKLSEGICPIYEPGLDILLKRNLSAGKLSFTTDLEKAVKRSLVVFICVGTPQDIDGKADLKYVRQAAEQIGKAMNGEKVIVDKSTVPVGTADMVKEIISKHSKAKFHVVSNPEFLREGIAVRDFMEPDRIVVGCEDAKAKKIMQELYAPLKSKEIYTDVKSAELVKYASNTFLAVKISFINEIAMLADKLGANINDVSDGLGSDKRINPYFLHAGCGWGGSCLPKDVSALLHTARQNGVELNTVAGSNKTNTQAKQFPVKKLKLILGDLKGKRIALLGLAFKANTDDMREASSIAIAEELKKAGASICAYDPIAQENARKAMPFIEYCDNPYKALTGADALILVTEWPEFTSLDYRRIKKQMKRHIIIDGRNFLDKKMLTGMGYEYEGIGV